MICFSHLTKHFPGQSIQKNISFNLENRSTVDQAHRKSINLHCKLYVEEDQRIRTKNFFSFVNKITDHQIDEVKGTDQ